MASNRNIDADGDVTMQDLDREELIREVTELVERERQDRTLLRPGDVSEYLLVLLQT